MSRSQCAVSVQRRLVFEIAQVGKQSLRDLDPVAVQCLACGGAEMIEAVAQLQKVEMFSSHILRTTPELDIAKVRSRQRLYRNAFKHMTTRGGVRDDTTTLAAFDDSANDAALFIGWWDYQMVTKKLPLSVQVFQVWWYALNEEKLTPGADTSTMRKVFPDVTKVSRAEQNRRLRRAAEKYRHDKILLSDPQTEGEPLCFPASVFKSHN
jgi:hypothetical protein